MQLLLLFMWLMLGMWLSLIVGTMQVIKVIKEAGTDDAQGTATTENSLWTTLGTTGDRQACWGSVVGLQPHRIMICSFISRHSISVLYRHGDCQGLAYLHPGMCKKGAQVRREWISTYRDNDWIAGAALLRRRSSWSSHVNEAPLSFPTHNLDV